MLSRAQQNSTRLVNLSQSLICGTQGHPSTTGITAVIHQDSHSYSPMPIPRFLWAHPFERTRSSDTGKEGGTCSNSIMRSPPMSLQSRPLLDSVLRDIEHYEDQNPRILRPAICVV